jgi:hypothetical protein
MIVDAISFANQPWLGTDASAANTSASEDPTDPSRSGQGCSLPCLAAYHHRSISGFLGNTWQFVPFNPTPINQRAIGNWILENCYNMRTKNRTFSHILRLDGKM